MNAREREKGEKEGERERERKRDSNTRPNVGGIFECQRQECAEWQK